MTYEQIHNLFKQRYNQINWKQFLGEAFAKSRLLATPEILTGIDSNVASQVQKLGYITLNENGIERQIAVYEVTLAQGIILERNRVGLRNLLSKYWKDIDAAFIAYHRPESPKWRFTYVSELTGYDVDGEFVKVKTEPKRYTYVLGEGESTRTAAERFTTIASKGSKATLDDVKEAFSVEKLSKAFFDEYKKHYDIFCDFMVSKPNIRQTIFNGDEKGIRDFNKKLLGRIVFLYFIQKKGWLGVPAKSDWGKGDFDFLTNLFKNTKNPDLFYSDLLSKLFFDTLNTKRKDDLIELVKGESCRIPYLNGGLFEEDDKKHRNLIFPANLFKSLFDFFNQYNFTIYEDDPNDHTVAVDPEMLGHIFENLLEDNKDKGTYYTPKEIVHYMCQESLIEYLTTWFEHKGYEVVGYIGFDKTEQPQLFSANEGRKGQLVMETYSKDTGKQIDRLLIEKLLKKKLDDDDKKLIKKHSAEFHTALDRVKICDPAIGSGAFPMGLLHEIFTAKQTLHTFEHGNTKTFDSSAAKLNIIQNSIYGVDIEKGAVDIARLRFWLSLIVDEEKPKALPNLDYKIVVGNSLVSKLGDEIINIDWTLNETSHGLFGADLAKQKGDLLKMISKEQKEFFNPDSDKKKLATNIRKLKIDLLITQLELMISTKGIEKQPTGSGATVSKQTEIYLQTIGWKNSIKDLQKLRNKPELPLHFFDWKLDFPEVMNDIISLKKDIGFDIVIANPPYVGVKGNHKIFDEIKHSYLSKFLKGRSELFYFFIHQAINLGKLNCINTFITTNYYITASDANVLRKALREETTILKLLNFNEMKLFPSAQGQHNMITIFKKGLNKDAIVKSFITKYKGFPKEQVLPGIFEFVDTNTDYFTTIQAEIFEGHNHYIRIGGTSGGSSSLKSAFEAINCEQTLGDICFVRQGLRTGIDKVTDSHIEKFNYSGLKGEGVFILTETELNEKGISKKDKLIRPLFKNSDVEKYVSRIKTNKYLIYTDNNISLSKIKSEHTAIYNHLKAYKDLIIKIRNQNNEDSGTWFILDRPREEWIFEGEKIVAPQRSRSNTFGFNSVSWYSSADVYYIKTNSKKYNLKYILALLNSKLFFIWLLNKGKRKGEMLELYQQPLSEIPIKEVSKSIQSALASLAEKIIILKSENKDTSFLEQEIDNLVYKLYELTYNEVIVIDPAFSLSKKEYEAIKLE